MKILNFISERGNTYLASFTTCKLYHLTTGQCVNDMESKKLLEYFEHGEKSYVELRNEIFVDKTKTLPNVI